MKAIDRNVAWAISLLLIITLTAFTGCSDDDDPTAAPANDDDNDDPVELVEGYQIVDTDQSLCYDASDVISAPAAGEAFYGQDALIDGNQPSYVVSSDGLTVYDEITGLTWVFGPDTDGDGVVESPDDKLTWTQAQAYPATLNAAEFAGYDDWRLPAIKELYSLILFSGEDVSPESPTGGNPFIDTDAFEFVYGNMAAMERVIDSQYASSTLYVADSAEGQLLFGVNFADGRIKGYGLEFMGQGKTFFVQCCRGNADYGVNDFADNGDATVTDAATGLMWMQDDSGEGMIWQDALAWVEARNAETYLGHADWRLPNVKELESIVDYTRSPKTTASAAIDPVFSATMITNEAGDDDYAFYWSGTTHANEMGGGNGCYVAFGRSLGYMNETWVDVHGAGSQRSDPKIGDPADYPTGHGPQGDAIRIYNFVRLVRGAE
jgi:Protein of unknown function (DUF1566)